MTTAIRSHAMRRLLATSMLLLGLTGCGLSQEVKSKYSKEIKYAAQMQESARQAVNRFQALEKEAMSIGYFGSGALGSAQEYEGKMQAFRNYEACLNGYLESKEKFVIAKTNCTLESDIPR